MKVIERRAKIPEYLKQQNSELLQEFINEYTDQESGKVDYRGIIDDLRYFDYTAATTTSNNKNIIDKQENSSPKFERVEPVKRTIFDDDYVVLDS